MTISDFPADNFPYHPHVFKEEILKLFYACAHSSCCRTMHTYMRKKISLELDDRKRKQFTRFVRSEREIGED